VRYTVIHQRKGSDLPLYLWLLGHRIGCQSDGCHYWSTISESSLACFISNIFTYLLLTQGGSVAEWLTCWTQAKKARVQIAVATLSGNSLRQTVHTHRVSVHQAAKLVAALLRVARVTAGLAECNGSYAAGFMTHITCRLTVKNRDQLRNPTLGNRVWASFIINPSGNPLNQGPDLQNILRQSYDNVNVTIDSRQMCNSQDILQ